MYKQKNFYRGPLANNRIKAKEVRVISETGEQLGIMSLQEALKKALEKNLDLVQVTEKVEPPVCKITNFGKYLYNLKKKDKSAKHHSGELKGIRLTFAISEHDIETKAKQAVKFLTKGDKIMVEMRLRGREKAHPEIARQKITTLLDFIGKSLELKTERELKREPRGFTMIITKK